MNTKEKEIEDMLRNTLILKDKGVLSDHQLTIAAKVISDELKKRVDTAVREKVERIREEIKELPIHQRLMPPDFQTSDNYAVYRSDVLALPSLSLSNTKE